MDVSPLMHRVAAALDPDPSRVIAQLYLPGEELRAGGSRAGAVVERVLALSDARGRAIGRGPDPRLR